MNKYNDNTNKLTGIRCSADRIWLLTKYIEGRVYLALRYSENMQETHQIWVNMIRKTAKS